MTSVESNPPPHRIAWLAKLATLLCVAAHLVLTVLHNMPANPMNQLNRDSAPEPRYAFD